MKSIFIFDRNSLLLFRRSEVFLYPIAGVSDMLARQFFANTQF